MVLLSPDPNGNVGAIQNSKDIPSINRLTEEVATKSKSKVGQSFIPYSPVTSGVEILDLTEDESIDAGKKAGYGTSQTNPINLEPPIKTTRYDIVSDSEDECPEELPIHSASQNDDESILKLHLQQHAELNTSSAPKDQKALKTTTNDTTIADSDLGEMDSEVNFSSDDDLDSVISEAQKAAQESGSVWRPTTTPWYSDDEDEEDDVGDDFDLDDDSQEKAMAEFNTQNPAVVWKGPKSHVHFGSEDEIAVPCRRMFVEDSQAAVPTKTSLGDSMDVNHENLNPWIKSTPRAPSPSDAAMVKAAMAKMPTEMLNSAMEAGTFNPPQKKVFGQNDLSSFGGSTSCRWTHPPPGNNVSGFEDYSLHQQDFESSVDRGFSRYDDGPFSGWQKYDPMSGVPAAPSQHFNPPHRPIGFPPRYEPSYPLMEAFHSAQQYSGYSGEIRNDFPPMNPVPSILVGGKCKLPESDMAQGICESKPSKLPISDIVNSSPRQSGPSARSLKRKADEITMDESNEPVVAQVSQTQASSVLRPESGFPDAQPRGEPTVSEFFSQESLIPSTPIAQQNGTNTILHEHGVDLDRPSHTQFQPSNQRAPKLTLIDAHTYAQSMAQQHRKNMPQPLIKDTEAPARKRVKTSLKGSGRVGAFVSGLVVGGLSLAGAFAAFIATIPENVKDEARREFHNRT